MLAFVPVADHARCDGDESHLAERVAQVAHVRPQVAFRAARQLAAVLAAVMCDVVVGEFVERERGRLALALPRAGRQPFHDPAPVEVDQQLFLLQPFLGADAAARAERALASHALVRVSAHPCLDGAVLPLPGDDGPELPTFHEIFPFPCLAETNGPPERRPGHGSYPRMHFVAGRERS